MFTCFWGLKLDWDRSGLLAYAFRITDGQLTTFFDANGIEVNPKKDFELRGEDFKPLTVPSWVEQSVFYQIFPDRFDNGDKSNDPKDVQPWNSEPTYVNRFGGDIAGVEKHLDHLKGLGINAIYFNPVMRANSNHRYDPADYYQIDPEFGTNDQFAKLTKILQGKGIRTVVDQIFDHCGITFGPFKDLLENQQESKYKDYFFVNSWPVTVKENPPYTGWWGSPYMPKLNLQNKQLYDYLMDSVDYWHKHAAISGWRLDVANEVPEWFWRDFRKRVKGLEPNAYIVGEVWGDASQWLKGDEWDASMNYPFREAVLGYVATGKLKASDFMRRLMNVYNLYAPQVSRNQLNLISSHDTPRFLTLCGGNRDLAKLGAIVQFTWVGSPSIYYGEELGMEGGKDPQNRRPMRWDLDRPDNSMLQLYKKLVHLRTSSAVLQSGDPIVIGAWDREGVAAYARLLGNEAAVVVLNRSNSLQTKSIALTEGLPRNDSWTDGLTGKVISADPQGRLQIRMEPLSAVIALSHPPSSHVSARPRSKQSGASYPHRAVFARQTQRKLSCR